MTNDKYYELDKQASDSIMPEFKGKVIDTVCFVCNGDKTIIDGNGVQVECSNCNGEGHYEIEY